MSARESHYFEKKPNINNTSTRYSKHKHEEQRPHIPSHPMNIGSTCAHFSEGTAACATTCECSFSRQTKTLAALSTRFSAAKVPSQAITVAPRLHISASRYGLTCPKRVVQSAWCFFVQSKDHHPTCKHLVNCYIGPVCLPTFSITPAPPCHPPAPQWSAWSFPSTA